MNCDINFKHEGEHVFVRITRRSGVSHVYEYGDTVRVEVIQESEEK